MNMKTKIPLFIAFLLAMTTEMSSAEPYKKLQADTIMSQQGNRALLDPNLSILRIFYTKYCDAVNIDPKDYYSPQSDTLVAKYCTKKFYAEIKDEIANGVAYDLLTDDYGMSKDAAKTLEITRIEPFVYQVKYVTKSVTWGRKEPTETVTLKVKMQDGRIDDVTNAEHPQF